MKRMSRGEELQLKTLIQAKIGDNQEYDDSSVGFLATKDACKGDEAHQQKCPRDDNSMNQHSQLRNDRKGQLTNQEMAVVVNSTC